MLGPAVNRQPGFRRGTRRAKQRSEEHCLLQSGCCNLVADFHDQLAGNLTRFCLISSAGCLISVCLSAWLAGLARWVAGARWHWLPLTDVGCCWLLLASAGCGWPLRRPMFIGADRRELNLALTGAVK